MSTYIDKQSRALKHQKAEKPKIGIGQPPSNDGFEGENRIQMINGVPRLYYRTNNQWYFTGLSQDGAVPDVPIASPTQLGIIKIGSGGTIASDGTYTATAATPAADDIAGGDAAVTIATSSSSITIGPGGQDEDILFKGNDDGAAITALTLDMSASGEAFFRSNITIGAFFIMPVVTSGILLIADGTSYQEIALGGDATIVANGTMTIVNNAITNAKIADDAVDSDEIAAGAIDFAHMSVNSINSDQYVDGSIDVAHMSANSIDSAQYVDGSIDTAHIANDQITNALMADDAIDSAQLASGSVDDGHLSDGVATGLAGTGLAASSGVLNVIGGNGITANANDMAITAAQTTITSIYNTSLIIGEDSATAIDFGSANEIDFLADGLRLTLTAIRLAPETNNEIDLGTSSLKYKDIYAHGTIYSTNFEGNLTGTVTNAAHVTITNNINTNEDNKIPFIEDGEATGNNGLESNANFHYNPSTGKVTATLFAGSVTTATQSNIDHDSLANHVANEHISHTSAGVVAGTGLTGGGDLTASRTLNVIGGTGITANANDIAIDASDMPTLTALTVDNININGSIINCTSGDLTITAAGGDIGFGNENLATTGTFGCGTIACGEVTSENGAFWVETNDESGTKAGLKRGAEDRIDIGWGGTYGGNMECYSKSHASRPGEFRVVYGGGDFGSYQLWHYSADGSATEFSERVEFDKAGKITCEDDVIAFGTLSYSDIKFKENIKDIKYGLSDILKMRSVDYDWNIKEKNHDIGFIAQEMEKIVPEIVKEVKGLNNKGNYLTINYSKIVPILVQSIKELKSDLDELRKKIDG